MLQSEVALPSSLQTNIDCMILSILQVLVSRTLNNRLLQHLLIWLAESTCLIFLGVSYRLNPHHFVNGWHILVVDSKREWPPGDIYQLHEEFLVLS